MTDFTTKTSSLKEARERIRHCLEEMEPSLDLADLGLENVPLELRQLAHLSALDLSDNKITSLPPFLGKFSALEYLDISRNKLVTLPQVIGKLQSLKGLNLRGNELSSLPEFIAKLSKLEQLDCSRNRLTTVPEVLGQMPTLKNLSISRNNFKTLPESVRSLSGLDQLSLTKHIEELVTYSRAMGLHEDFFDYAKQHVKFVSRFFHVSAMQAVLYAHFLIRYEDQHISTMEISSSLNCESSLGILPWLPEFYELEKKKLLYCQRDEGSLSFRVPEAVIEAVRKGEEYQPARHDGVPILEFFEILGELFYRKGNNELLWEMLTADAHSLLEHNTQLEFAQKVLAYQFNSDCETLLLYFCHLFANQGNDRIWLTPLDNEVYDQKHKNQFRKTRQQFEEGSHTLIQMNLIKKRLILDENDDLFGEREAFSLTDKAKTELLQELQISYHKANTDLIAVDSIAQKPLFFNERETDQIKRLSTLLQDENYQAVRARLAQTGQRGGIVCLFSGASGTGKTETAYQIARETGRDLLLMNIAEMRDKWVGESEKLTKALFDRYRETIKNSAMTPILLFNEADAILSKRIALSEDSRSVDQMSNAVQNILLQELETLDGILIATTNMSLNLDRAFERRFLFKIEFGKPDINTRRAIWRSMNPELSDQFLDTLAARFDFTGGQIENITRRRMIEYITSGVEPSLEQLISFCEEESPEQEVQRFIL